MGELYYQDKVAKLYNSDCRAMSDLPDETVQMVVTSPPYWGLRKYSGLPDLIWGGKEDCQHDFSIDTLPRRNRGTLDIVDSDSKQATNFASAYDAMPMKFCSLCGVWKGQLGLEPTSEMYIAHLIQIFREVKRVLRKDGVCFVNIGDSYNTSPAGNKQPSGFQQKSKAGMSGALAQFPFDHARYRIDNYDQKSRRSFGNLKPKDLCLIPFRLAIALQEDGWWVRSVIIWNKPNPMPESVTDRPTESHEYILMLTKSARYYWDMEAIRESNVNPNRTNFTSGKRRNGINPDRNDNDLGYRSESFVASGRNMRSVWTFPTQNYKEAHFATYPEKLVEICVKAATPEVGCCSKCGKPWVRIVETIREPTRPGYYSKTNGLEADVSGRQDRKQRIMATSETLGWKQTCKCDADKVPSVVLDPFAGSGTTLAVAKRLGRKSVGYELSEKYCKLAIKRIESETAPMRLE